MTTMTAELTGRDILGGYTDRMITAMTSAPLNVPQFEAELAVSQLWERWVRAYREAPGADPALAGPALTAALLYLRDGSPGDSPGPLADSGWHLMLSHDTRAYAALSQAMCGVPFRHHVPNDVTGIAKRGKCNDTNDGGGTSKCVCS